MKSCYPLQVGILFSESGSISTIGRSQVQGTLMAIEEINESGGVNGRELIPIKYDAQSDPAIYAKMAEKLIRNDKVNVIFGCYMSSSRKSVIPIIEKWNKILFYPTLYEGFEFSPNLIYTGAAPNQNSVQLAEFMTSQFGARVYLIGSNYIYPYESNRIMRNLVKQRPGGENLGERYVSLNASVSDYMKIMKDVKRKNPDFIFSTVVGDSTAELYKAYCDAGFDSKKMPIASLTTSEAEIVQMGNDVAEGHFTSAPYFNSIESKNNKQFLERINKKKNYEIPPNLCLEAAYFQVHIFANAFRQCDSDSIDVIMPYILGSDFDAPQGRIFIEPSNHHTRLYPRIGKINRHGQFEIVRESLKPIHPDPYMVAHSLGDWTAKLSKTK